MSKHFAVIHINGNEITGVTAKWNKRMECIAEDFSRIDSKGFKRGIVSNFRVATESVSDILNRLRKRSGGKINDVYVGVSVPSIKISKSYGTLILSKYGRDITDRDINKCVGIASTVKLPLSKEPLHELVSGFSVDGEKGIKNPIDLECIKLEANVNIITVKSSVLQNIEKCVSQAGFIPAGFIFSGLASSYRVIGSKEKERGAALVNISKDTTEILFFKDGVLSNCKVVPIGIVDLVTGKNVLRKSSVDNLCKAIKDLSLWNKTRKVVLIGEGLIVDNMIELMEQKFKIPVQAGICCLRPSEKMFPERNSYIGNLGILDYLQDKKKNLYANKSVIGRFSNSVGSFMNKYF